MGLEKYRSYLSVLLAGVFISSLNLKKEGMTVCDANRVPLC